jgi:hypothetical protein
MTHYEYLMVMVSIILGLGATQALRGLSKIARSHSRFLPATLWVTGLFYLHIQVWWGFWDMASVPSWTQLSYYLIIFLPCSLFAATELLVPIGAGADTDWKAHFFSVQKWFLGALITFQLVAILANHVLMGVPLTHPYRILQGTIALVMTVGLFTASVRVHAWIAGTFLALLLIGQVLFRLTPGLSS